MNHYIYEVVGCNMLRNAQIWYFYYMSKCPTFCFCSITRDDFYQLFNCFYLFFCEEEIPKIAGQSEQVKNDHFEMGCRWFQLFYFLSRILLSHSANHLEFIHNVWDHKMEGKILFQTVPLFLFLSYARRFFRPIT
jgi:hypothetical protein